MTEVQDAASGVKEQWFPLAIANSFFCLLFCKLRSPFPTRDRDDLPVCAFDVSAKFLERFSIERDQNLHSFHATIISRLADSTNGNKPTKEQISRGACEWTTVSCRSRFLRCGYGRSS